MPTELEELVEFLHSLQPAVKQIALDNCVQFSAPGPNQKIFAYNNYTAIKDLKTLARDTGRTTVRQLVTILANLCDDTHVRDLIAEDADFIRWLVFEICNVGNMNADLMCILLANVAKNDKVLRVFEFSQDEIKNDTKHVFTSKNAVDCLMDCFVKGADRSLNKYADFDYLAYFFANLLRFTRCRDYLVTEQTYDGVIPLSKLLVFTEKYDLRIRREGVASTIKNALFDTQKHMQLMDAEGTNLLPYILLPLAGGEELDDDEMFALPDELQLLGDDKARDPLPEIMAVHLELLLLLCTTRPGREYLREKSVYPMVRELHKVVEDEQVGDLCDRLVQMLMRDEAVVEEEESDDEAIVEVA